MTDETTNEPISLEARLNEWDDETVLLNLSLFLNRVGLSTQFIQNEDGLLTHQLLAMSCGDKILMSDPQELEWPLQPMPIPEAFEGKLN